jgi:hemoglobin-like flavoprotein
MPEAVAASVAEEAVKPPASPTGETVEKPQEQPTPAEEPLEAAEQPAQEEAEEQEPDLEAQPETSGDFSKYKHLFKEHPELRNIIGREKAFSELGDYPEVRQIVERVPTLADAEQLFEDAEEHRTMGSTFREDPNLFLESLKDSDGLAYGQLLKTLPQYLAENDQSLWTEQATQYTDTVLSNLYGLAQQQQNADLANAVVIVAQSLGMPVGMPRRMNPQPSSEVEKLRRQLAEKEQAEAEAQFQSYWGSVDEAITANVGGEIEKQIRSKFPNASEDDVRDMAREGWAATMSLLSAQPQTRAQMESYETQARKGRRGEADFRSIVTYATGRAKLAVPKALAPVITKWSKRIVQKNNAEIDTKRNLAAATRDAGKGPQATGSVNATGKPSGKRTSEQVFRELESRTYSRPA